MKNLSFQKNSVKLSMNKSKKTILSFLVIGFLLAIMFVIAVNTGSLSVSIGKLFKGLFVSYDAELLDMTVSGLKLFSPAFLLMGFNIFSISFFTALNNGRLAGFMSFVRTFVFQVLALLTLPSFLGLNGIWLASLVAETMMLLVSYLALKKMDRKYHYYSLESKLSFRE